MKRCLKGKCYKTAMTLDICKAYDRIGGCFLDVIMRKLGFDDKWVRLILNCVFYILCSTYKW